MEYSAGLRKIARLNCPGGGQVVVDRQFACIGHMDPGVGTSIADVSDHQPVETITGSDVPVAWFSQGLRIIDFSNPMRPHQTACYIPEAADPQKRVSSNDVFVASRGLLYLIDRMSGLTILERT